MQVHGEKANGAHSLVRYFSGVLESELEDEHGEQIDDHQLIELRAHLVLPALPAVSDSNCTQYRQGYIPYIVTQAYTHILPANHAQLNQND